MWTGSASALDVDELAEDTSSAPRTIWSDIRASFALAAARSRAPHPRRSKAAKCFRESGEVGRGVRATDNVAAIIP